MSEEEQKALQEELTRLRLRALRWKVAAKLYRDRWQDVFLHMDTIINDIIDESEMPFEGQQVFYHTKH